MVGLVLKANIVLAPPPLPNSEICLYSLRETNSFLALFIFSQGPTQYDACGSHDDCSLLPTPGD